MKRIRKVLITLLIIIAAAAGILLYVQYDNITALIHGLSASSEDLATEMDDNREKLKTEVEKYTSGTINDMTAEDEEKLLSGEITIEDVAEKYNLPLEYMTYEDIDAIKSTGNNSSTSTTTAPGTSAVDASVNTKAIDAAISDGVSKMYALKAKYVNKLGELEREVIKEYTSIPKEKQNEDSKYSIVMGNVNYVAELEQKCDSEVAKVLSTLETELKKLKGDTEIIQILQDAYQSEKEVKKSYYLSLYKN
ncbi:MAG: hypothetical protein WBJ13_07635 [Sedimentibacter sp.]